MAVVLIIEDNVEHAELARRVLKGWGHEVLLATDGAMGLQMAVDHHPNVILLDLGLPDVDGQTLLGWLRRAPGVEKVPVIAVTAWPDDVARQMVAAYGFDGYISKPISVTALGGQVASRLEPDVTIS